MAKTITQLVGENVARHRKRRGWKQDDLAARIRELQSDPSGRRFHRSAVSHLESGLRALNVSDLTLIALALDLPPSALLLLPETDGDGEPIEHVTIDGPREFEREQLQRQGATLDPDSPAQFILEISRGLALHVEESEALLAKLHDLHSLTMTARVRATRQLQASEPERSGD